MVDGATRRCWLGVAFSALLVVNCGQRHDKSTPSTTTDGGEGGRHATGGENAGAGASPAGSAGEGARPATAGGGGGSAGDGAGPATGGTAGGSAGEGASPATGGTGGESTGEGASPATGGNGGGTGAEGASPANPTVMSVNSCSAGISWLPPHDGVGVAGYNVYRDGVFLAFTEESVYNDNSGLDPETSHTYRISALDTDDNESTQSEPVTATTLPETTNINPDSHVIPEHSLADWTTAGVVGGIPTYPAGVDVRDHGSVGDGTADDTAAINAAIAACPDESAVILPEGVYLVTSTINVSKAIVLRGQGPDATVVRHSHDRAGITLTPGADHAGIEDLHLETVYPFENMGGTKISFSGVENSWVKNIETSGYTDRSIDIEGSSHCEVRDSYIHHSYEAAVEEGRTHFYGVHIYGLNNKANYNLVENNVLDWFSSPMIVQHEAHYSVYAYNFSWNAWGGDGAYSVRADFEIHHYDYTNPPYDYDEPPAHKFVYYLLSEGNVFEQGQSAQFLHRKNTFFRNRVNNGGIGLGYDNIAFGNELTVKKNPGTFNPGSTDDNSIRTIRLASIVHGNYVSTPDLGLEWDPDIADHDIPDSFYLESKPEFFGDLPWPCFGGDLMPGNARRSPAEIRYWSIVAPEEAPSELEARADGIEITLSWQSNSTNEVDFIISRSIGDGEFQRIAQVPDTTYTDTVSDSEERHYYVRAVNHLGGRNHVGELRFSDLGGESEPSEPVSVTP